METWRTRLRAVVPARVLSAVLLLCGALLAGCSSGTPDSEPSAPPTPIARLNTAAMTIPRIDFCSLVPRDAVHRALGTWHWKRAAHGNGDRARVGSGTRATTDVVAEHGCSWVARAGLRSRADAWVFARPVDPAFAKRVVRASRHAPDCRDVDGPRFGRPSLTQVCDLGTRTRVRHAGLFDSTWLTCQVTVQAKLAEARHRADAWCVRVANALNTTR